MTILFGKHRGLRAIGTCNAWIADLRQQVERTTAGDVVFDISCAETINSEELAAITTIHLALTRQDRRLQIINARRQIEEVFEITRMNRLIHVTGMRPEPEFNSALKIAGAAR